MKNRTVQNTRNNATEKAAIESLITVGHERWRERQAQMLAIPEGFTEVWDSPAVGMSLLLRDTDGALFLKWHTEEPREATLRESIEEYQICEPRDVESVQMGEGWQDWWTMIAANLKDA